MANIRKTFNFRNGVQVDEDNFIVDSLGKVGIGTTVPTQMLDVRGDAKVVGILTSQSIEVRNVNVSGVTTFSGNTHVGAAITMYPSAGIISATQTNGICFNDGMLSVIFLFYIYDLYGLQEGLLMA